MSKKILAVYPDEATLGILKSSLCELGGYEVETEAEAQRALEAIERTQPDLLLMEVAPLDLRVGREEFQVMTEIRKRHPTLTIVMLIDFVETDLIEKAKQLKVEDYIVKFDIEETLRFLGEKLVTPWRKDG